MIDNQTIDRIALQVAHRQGMGNTEKGITQFARLFVEQLMQEVEPFGWVHKEDVEYDGTTHSLRVVNVQPYNFEDWLPCYTFSLDEAEIKA